MYALAGRVEINRAMKRRPRRWRASMVQSLVGGLSGNKAAYWRALDDPGCIPQRGRVRSHRRDVEDKSPGGVFGNDT